MRSAILERINGRPHARRRLKLEPRPLPVATAKHALDTTTVAEAAVPSSDAKDDQPVAEMPGAAQSMIRDSKSIRGRFTGSDPIGSNLTELPTNRHGAIVGQEDWAATSIQPQKKRAATSLRKVVDATARDRVTALFDDVSESHQVVAAQAIDSSADRATRGQLPAVEPPQPLTGLNPVVNAKPITGATAAQDAAVEPARRETRTKSEAWFAIGLAVGLGASVILWLGTRPKVDEPVV
jgi:hypothetical protein